MLSLNNFKFNLKRWHNVKYFHKIKGWRIRGKITEFKTQFPF